ncbi:30S ribosome-binding factor RbfA [Endozoicomonas elysicola]|uniref:Ribosome-binding factor A n=1 Tax=Endozoicomonas elysicola TaxID=305900 RepID=A0A081KG91_9GAMM|nr:30S ribosome-binding factor RbfA [Endozoicomonas elysicola]KEI73167.1 ribosome-binding factor A [Endozoicomonas elysicola]
MAKEYSRKQRVAEQIQKELAQLIQLEMKDPRLGMVTVSAVEVSRDLAFADVYVSFLGVDEQERIDQSLKILGQAAGFLRSQLARAIKLRFTPQLRFYYDSSLQRGAYLSSLIDEAVAKDAQAGKGIEGSEE